MTRTTTFMLQRISAVPPYIFLFIAMTTLQATAIGVCSSSTRWDPARSVCVATLGGIIDACKKERGKWSFTCSKETHETTTTTTTVTAQCWAQQAYLKAPNAAADDRFGFSTAISGDTIVVGATGEASSATSITNGATGSADNSASGAGAAYVFVNEPTTATPTGSGPTQIGERAPLCDSQTTVYDERQSQCVASYIKSARSCIEGSLVGSTNGRVSCGQVNYPPPPTPTDY